MSVSVSDVWPPFSKYSPQNGATEKGINQLILSDSIFPLPIAPNPTQILFERDGNGSISRHFDCLVDGAMSGDWTIVNSNNQSYFAGQALPVQSWAKTSQSANVKLSINQSKSISQSKSQLTREELALLDSLTDESTNQSIDHLLTESYAPIIDVSIVKCQNDESVNQSDNQSVNQSVLPYSAGLDRKNLLEEFASLTQEQYIKLVDPNQSINQSVDSFDASREAGRDWTAQDSTSQSANQSSPKSSNQSSNQSNKQSNKQSNNQPFSPSTNRDISELDSLLLDDSEAWLAAMQANTQSTNQSVNQWVSTTKFDTAFFADMVPNPSITYPFELDVFQKEAIIALERGLNVFVAAHTSAGKTVVAEYAIATAMKSVTRAIYTSPIKTLSNQKFREFRNKFGASEVGLITGDVSIQPEAPCLIMTTEILRSMLYKGADLLRDLSFVIFDEIHYINDAERGVVWEEALVLLPSHTQIVLLSATVPNVTEFASWVGRIKQKPIHVIYTLTRPVPLQHAIYIKGKTYDFYHSATGKYLPNALKLAKEEGVSDKKKALALKGVNTRPRSVQPPWHAMIKMLQSQSLLPCVIFCFSKKLCETSASSLTKLDLTTHSDKSQILVFISSALGRLSTSDRRLPQCLHVKDLARRGIGVHHAGMLPILKEMVEILYGRGLLKVLFATETFAMGVNMPCRTVAFHSLRKHDGTQFRPLLPGEYTQMSGRAGRRGIDDYGLVLVVATDVESLPEELALRTISTGKPTRLESKFRLTFNMILNLLRQEELRVEDMMRASFAESNTQRHSKDRARLLQQSEQVLARCQQEAQQETQHCHHCEAGELALFAANLSELEEIQSQLIRQAMVGSALTARILKSGRVLVLGKFDSPPALAIFLKIETTNQSTNQFSAFMLLPSEYSSSTILNNISRSSDVAWVETSRSGRHVVLVKSLRVADVQAVSSYVCDTVNDLGSFAINKHARDLEILTDYMIALESRHHMQQCKSGLLLNPNQSNNQLPLLPFMADVKINILDVELANLASLIDRRSDLVSQLSSLDTVQSCPSLSRHLSKLTKSMHLSQQVAQLRSALDDSNLTLMRDYEAKLRVLQSLRFIDSNKTVSIKGRVACELNTCDSLIGTEIIFANAIKDLPVESIVAAVSCLLFKERHADQPDPSELDEQLSLGLDRVREIVESLAHVQVQCGVDLGCEPHEWVESQFNAGLAHVVYAWACNMPFIEICTLTNVLEGSIVRLINRLDETCKDLRNAARIIGDRDLYEKMERASTLIRRDIVFAASLYLS